MGSKLEHLRHGRLVGPSNSSDLSCVTTGRGGALIRKSREAGCSYDPIKMQLEEVVSWSFMHAEEENR